MLRRLAILVFTTSLMVIVPQAMAIGLDAARHQGLVGEIPNGYIGAIKAGDAEVDRLVADVNAKRRSRYSQIAKKNRLSVSSVAEQAGVKLISKVPAGQYVRRGGRWQKKKP